MSVQDKSVRELIEEKSRLFLTEDEGEEKNSLLIQHLRRTGRSNKEFETMISNLSLEDLIGLKLELAFRSIKKGLYGLPLWSAITALSKDAILTAVLSRSKTKIDAARMLGMRYSDLGYFATRYLLREVYLNKNRDKIHNEMTNTVEQRGYEKDKELKELMEG